MSFDDFRSQIDRIDGEIVRLLNKRAKVALRIGEEKRRNNSPVRDPRREDMVLKRVASLSKGPLDEAQIEGIYRRVIAACARLQKGGARR